MSANKNYPAFPNKLPRGMTLRDYFAAEAMLAIIGKRGAYHHKSIAEVAYQLADAMLAERDKGGAE